MKVKNDYKRYYIKISIYNKNFKKSKTVCILNTKYKLNLDQC